jgi:hypothetical protein
MGVHELEDRIKKRMDYRNCVLITRFFFATNLPFPERSSSARTPRGLLEPARIPERHSNSTMAGIKISMEVLPASQNNHAWKDERITKWKEQQLNVSTRTDATTRLYHALLGAVFPHCLMVGLISMSGSVGDQSPQHRSR